MKDFLISLVLYIAKAGMRIIYFFIKLFTKQKKNKITMLSRQSNNINLDFKLLKIYLEKNENLEIQVLCKKIPENLAGRIKYCFGMIKDMYHIATSKVCIVDGYNIPISALKHKKGLEVIQIWHALGAIKKFGYQTLDKEEGSNKRVAKIMQMHANYTLVTCASKATREFYIEAFGTDRDNVKVLGMPRIDYILGEEIKNKKEKILNENPILREKKNIVYVPTFRKGKKIDLNPLIQSIDETKYNLIIKLHPLDEAEVDKKYIIEKYSSTDLVNVADYVITDYSAMAFEAAILEKPLFFYLYDIDEYEEGRGLNINLKKEMKSSTSSKIEDIISIIENDTYNYEELNNFRNRYIETIDTNNTERIAKYIEEVME